MPHQKNQNHRLALKLTALIMSHGLAAAALAQSAPPPPAAKPGAATAPADAHSKTNAPTQLKDVVITGSQDQAPAYKPETVSSPKYTEPLRDTPQTINVVPRAVIEDQGATTLRDVLRNVPGISFQAGEGGVPAGDQMSIRGFSARTDMFIDGVRDIGGYTRDAFNIEQVEVSKGPNSAYSGRGSTGGAVNLGSKLPRLDAAYATDLSLGTDQYFRGTVDVNQPLPELAKMGLEGAAIRINGLVHDQDFAGRDSIHDKRWAVAPTLALGLGTDTRAIFSWLHLQEDNLAGYGLPFVSNTANPFGGASAVGHITPIPYNKFLGLVGRDYENVVNDIVGVRLEHDFSEDLTLRNQTRYARTKRDSVITAPRIVNNPGIDPSFGPNSSALNHGFTAGGINFALNHELQSRDQIDQIFANQADLTARFETWKLAHTLVTSFEVSHETEVNYVRSATTGTAFPFPAQTSNPLDPNPYDPFHPVFRTGARNEAISDGIGASGFDTIKFSEKWIGTVGVRLDAFSTTYNQYAAGGATTSFMRSDLMPTWRSGLVFKPAPNGSIYFGYGTSFNPSSEGLTLATTSVNLEPEVGESYELGTKWDFFKEKLSLSTALFRTEKNNFRTTDPVTAIVSTTGEVRVQGIEFGASGKITDQWSVYGGYVIMESDVLKSTTSTIFNGATVFEQGHRLSNTPEQTASLWSTYELPHHISLGSGVQFIDKRFANNYETLSVPGYWLQDAMISWKATDHLTLRLNVSNLWDKEYIDRVGGGHSIPGTGRTFILTASLKF